MPEGDTTQTPARSRTAPLQRVGHKGADHIVAGNTRASFDAALRAGVDMIEFDILPARRGDDELVLAHDETGIAGAETLEQGLEHLASPAFAGIAFDVDLKLPGYEREVLAALREYGLAERALISSMYPASLVRLRGLDASLTLGWSVPRVRRDYTEARWSAPIALAVIMLARRRLPERAARALRSGRVDAIMAQWRLVTPALVDTVLAAGGDLYVWTVDDGRQIAELEALGVTGVITNDPRLFFSS